MVFGFDKQSEKRHISSIIISILIGYPLANIVSAKKRARQNVKQRLHNMSAKSNLRTHIKKLLSLIEGGQMEDAKAFYPTVSGVIDKVASKGIIHKNKASRHKSRLVKKISA